MVEITQADRIAAIAYRELSCSANLGDLSTAFALHRQATEQSAAEREKVLVEALRPFVEGAAHTQVFLRSREKMHPAGQELYSQDVERARQALTKVEQRHG